MKCYHWKVRFISRTGETLNKSKLYSTHTDTIKAKRDGKPNEQSPCYVPTTFFMTAIQSLLSGVSFTILKEIFNFEGFV